MSNLNVFLYTMIVTALAVLLNGCSAMRPPIRGLEHDKRRWPATG